MKISNCCEAPFNEPGYPDNDICSKCLEHAEPIDEDTMQEDEILMYEEEHKHRPLPAQFGGDTGIDADYYDENSEKFLKVSK